MLSIILNRFESGDAPFVYKPSHRYILIFMCLLFLGLAALTFYLMPPGDYSYSFPVLVFGGTGILGIIIGTLGTDRAVAKIWGSK
ncbi:MAG: hypothetical protein ACI8Z1_000775 [Candidatus Azotimanducaceae bacterium]